MHVHSLSVSSTGCHRTNSFMLLCHSTMRVGDQVDTNDQIKSSAWTKKKVLYPLSGFQTSLDIDLHKPLHAQSQADMHTYTVTGLRDK